MESEVCFQQNGVEMVPEKWNLEISREMVPEIWHKAEQKPCNRFLQWWSFDLQTSLSSPMTLQDVKKRIIADSKTLLKSRDVPSNIFTKLST